VQSSTAGLLREGQGWAVGDDADAHVFKYAARPLKRRRVFRALIAYGLAAFAVLQIIEPMMHGLRWEATLSYAEVERTVTTLHAHGGRGSRPSGFPPMARRDLRLLNTLARA
jgi:hypothetical protein